jgi:DNA-binding MarR family transcriptional regulator
VVSSEIQGSPAPQVTESLSYLLKHARLRLSELTTAALEPYGVLGRELAVLMTLAGCVPSSQQQAARRLGVDRTTMVALLDTLEEKGLITRHPDAEDRRRNVVELTLHGRDVLRLAAEASAAAERRFLAPLSEADARTLKAALHTLALGP